MSPPTTDDWNGTGSWTANLSDWSTGAAPTSAEPAEIQTGTDTLTAAGTTAALQIDAGAQLQVNAGGVLTASGTTTVAGNFYLQNGASVSTTGGLTITGSGQVGLDVYYNGGSGGTSLTIGGTLTNNSTSGDALYIGNTGITAADTVKATALSNTGDIDIEGNTSVQAKLNITGAAGFGTAGVETGSVYLENDALLEFASGQITTISGSLQLEDADALVTSGSALTTNSALTGLATVTGDFYLQNGASVSTTGGLTITGSGQVGLDVYYTGGGGGTSLTIGGTLTNNSTSGDALYIGNAGISAADTVKATALNNTGDINLQGSGSALATLDITTGTAGFGTAGVETGSVYLNDALLEFASGQITTIDGQLQLNGPDAVVADAGSLTTNSALTGLATVAGNFYLQNGASISTSGGLTITGGGQVGLDVYYTGGGGGTSLTIGGTLTNNSTSGDALYIGNPNITAADTVKATALNNTGAIDIEGSGSALATLDITTGTAGFGTAGVETGSVYLENDALLEFASGQITTIDGQLQLNGPDAVVADAGSLTTNSALTGLATVAGNFYLQNGASVSTSGGLTITGGGQVGLDVYYTGGGGGTSLTIGGTLTNNSTSGDALYIGNPNITAADTVTATALNNTGAIDIEGSGSALATLDITTGTAGFGTAGVETGSVYLENDALLEFASGQITTIDGQLQLNGPDAVVADAGSLTTNSALTGLATVAGNFYLQNGASVSTTGGLTITGGGQVGLDVYYTGGSGGTSLTIGGTLTNNSTSGDALYIGNTSITAADTVKATALNNTGAIDIEGSGTALATLDITTGTAGFGTAGVETGSVYLENEALLEFASGQITTIAGQLQLNGPDAVVADAGSLTTNSALTGLATVAGDFYLQNGASVSTTGGLTITGSGQVGLDVYYEPGGGGTSLTIGGTLTNNSTSGDALYIGYTGISATDTVTTNGLNNAGVIVIEGNGTALGVLDINGPATNTGSVTIDASGEVVMGAGDTYTQAGGTTTINSGGSLVGGAVDVTGGSLDGTGVVDGTVDDTGGTVIGGPSYGNPGTLTIDGTYNQSGTGVLGANIANGGGSAGVVAVGSGDFVNLMGGTLLVSSTPEVGVLMTVMTFAPGDLVGQFASVQDGSASGDGSNVNLGDGDTLEVFYNNYDGNIQIEVVANTSLATSYEWTDGTGNWSTASDWSGGVVPGPTANVTIGSTTTGNVTLNSQSGDTTVNSLSILASNALTVSGVTLTSATGGAGISVASGGTLTLNGSGEIDGSVLSGAGLLQTGSGTGVLAGDTIAANTTFTSQNGATTVLLGAIDNAGSLDVIGGSGQNSSLTIGNSVTLTGGGTVTLTTGSGGGDVYVQGNGQTLTNTNNTIQGTGIIGNGSLLLINGGVIDATPEGGTSTLLLNGGGITNTGTLEAKAGGVLQISTTVDNAGGTVLVADSSSTVEVYNGTIQGGTLVNAAGGTLETVGSATLDGTTQGALTISTGSTYTASNGDTTTLYGSIVNEGSLDLIGGSGQNSYLDIGNSSSVTLTGGGTVTLTTESGGGGAYIQYNGSTLTNTNNTIQGTGIIGNGSLLLINGSVIDATPEGGTGTLTLNGGGITNTGTLEATAGGILTIDTNVTNTGATITASGSVSSGSSLVDIINGATIAGGTLNTVNGGVFETYPGSSAVLQGVTISAGSTYTASNGSITTLLATIDNAGSLDLIGGSGQNSSLYIGNSSSVTLTGGGTVTLTTGSGGGDALVQYNGSTLTNTNNTIQGTGIIGNGSLLLINDSVIDATPEGGTSTLTLNGSGGITNTGTLQAKAGGVLQISTTVDNAGGTVLVADSSSTVEVYNGTIQGGTLVNAAGGTLETVGSATLDGTTQGALTISTGSTYTASNGDTTTLFGSIINKGAIDLIGGSGQNSNLYIGNSSSVTLTGGGTVTLTTGSGGGNALVQYNGSTLTNTNNTIQGTGIIGNGSLLLINDSVIDATPEGGTSTLLLDGGVITNTGTLEAKAGGVLQISTTVDNAGGTVLVADSSSTVEVYNGTIQGGTLVNAAGGTLETVGSATLDGTTQGALTIGTGSTYTASNGDTTTLYGSIVNKGTIDLIGGSGQNSDLNIGNSSSVTLTGGGTVTLTTGSGGGYAFIQYNGSTLTNTNNTIQGTGIIGNGSLVLINGGVIDATPEGGTSTLTLNSSGGITNTGTLEATGGATLSLTNGTITNNGTVEAQNASAVTYGPGATNANNSGGVLTGGTWGAIASTGGATLSITGGAVTTDAAVIILSGANSVFQAGDGSTFTTLEDSLTTISAGGTLEVLGSRGYTTSEAITDDGLLRLGGGTFTAASLTIGTGAELLGYGTVAATVANSGTIEANGGTLDITDAESGTGALEAVAASVLQLAANAPLTTDSNFILLTGAGSEIEFGSGPPTTIENSLTTISATGTLELLGNRGYTTSLAMTDDGLLQLGGGTFTAASLTIGTGGKLLGYGTVASAIANSGTIVASGGTLDVTGAESGTGALEAVASSVLLLAANAPITTDSVLISLTGAGSELEFGTGTPTKIESSLTKIASGGTLAVLGNRGYTTTLGLTDSGLLQLAGGTFAAASLSVTSGSRLLGFGTVTPAVANAGTIEANGGTLDLSAGASGTGALIADVGATLELAGTTTTTTAGAVTANGTVDLVGGTLTAISVTVASGGELLAYGTVTPDVSNSGTIDVNGGALYLKGGVSGSGALIVTRGVTDLYGTDTAGAVTIDGTIYLNGATLTATAVTIASGGELTGYGTVNGPITNSGEIVSATTSTLKLAGTVSGTGALLTGGSTLELAGTTMAGAVTDAGTLKLDGITLTATSTAVVSKALLTGYGTVASPVTNSGTIEATGGTLDITGLESGTGALEAVASSVLQLAGNAPLTTDTVFISLTGAGSELEYGSGPPTTLEASLTTIASGGTLEVLGSRNYTTTLAMTDSGLLEVNGGTLSAASLNVTSGGEFIAYGTVTPAVVNSGTIQLNGGGLYLDGGVTGTGTLLATRGVMYLYGANSAGAITVDSTLEVTGATLSATSVLIAASGDLTGSGTIAAPVSDYGEIVAGQASTLKIAGVITGTGALLTGGSTLELAGTTTTGTVTDAGTLKLDGIKLTATSVTVASNTHLTGSGTIAAPVTSSGTIEATGGTLDITGAVSGTGILKSDAGATLELAGATAAGTVTDNGTLTLNGITLAPTSLTIASGAQLTGYGTVTSAVTNSGTIVASGGTLDVTGAESGTGALEAVASSVLLLAANAPITTDSVLISLTGAGSELEFGTGTPTKIESSLTKIASGGTLAVLGNRGYTTTLGLTDSGLLQLGGGTFAAASLSVTSGSRLLGFGTVTPAVANAGTIEANGGTLDLSAGASGTGALIADVGATLELAGTTTTTTAGAVTANGTVDLVGGTLTATSVTVASGGELLAYGTVTPDVSNSGTIDVNGGALYLKGGVSGSGALIVTRGVMDLYGTDTAGAVTIDGTIYLNGATLTATAVTIASGGELTGYGTVNAPITNSGEIVSATTSTLKLAGTVSGTGSLLTGGSTLELAGTTTAGAVTDAGTLKLDGITLTASSVTVGSGAHLIGAGTVASAVVNSGTIESNTSLLDVTGALTGTGTLKIDAGQTLEVGSSVASTQTAVFASTTGTLSLDQPINFAGSITNFTGSDAIYLGGQVATGFGGYNTATHVLTVLNGTTTIAELTFNGSYTLGNFSLTNGGLDIVDPPVTPGTTGVSPTPTFINASAGNDMIAMPAAGTGLDAISGFSLTNGDVLDFTAALKGTAWHNDLTQVGNFIAAVQNGSETDLYLDPNGNGHGSAVAALDGINTTVASLLAHNALRVG